MFAPAATEESDRELMQEATTSSSVIKDATDDGETALTSKQPKCDSVASLSMGMSWPNRKRLSDIQAVESELRRYQDKETIRLNSDQLAWWNSGMC